MTFSTGLFIIGLLPWFILIYSVRGRKERRMRIILTALANCVFLIWGGVGSFLFICAFAVIIRLFSLLVGKTKKIWLLALCLVLTVMPLVFFKYTAFLIGMINPLSDGLSWTSSMIIPLGISFVTFEAVSLLCDIYKGRTDKIPGFIDTYLYLSFFPTVTSGPIIRFNEFESGLISPSLSFDRAASVERIAIGLCKKTLIADKIAILADHYFDGIACGSSYSAAGLWIGSIAYTLQLYYDFSGYSDMAIGIGQLMGFDIRENFNRPYQADSISDFWKRWHMSLTQWFRDYVYIPLGGNRCSIPRHVFNMLVVWLITGLWHGADWNFMLWGVYYGILLLLEKLVFGNVLEKLPSLLRHVYCMFVVMIGWYLFSYNEISGGTGYLAALFGGGGCFMNRGSVYQLYSNAVLLVILILGSTTIPLKTASCILRKVRNSNTATVVLRGAFTVAVFLLSVAYLVGDSYNPFLYFRF